MMQPDLQEQMFRKAIINDQEGAKDRYFMCEFGKEG
jgi:hypothetical protein